MPSKLRATFVSFTTCTLSDASMDPQPTSQDPITGENTAPSVFQNIGQITIEGGSFHAIQGNAAFNTTHIYNNGVHGDSNVPMDKKPALLKVMPTNNFRTYHRNIVEKRAPGTGDIFKATKTVLDWVKTRGSRMWCTGGPGAGKTYLASVIIEMLEQMARKSEDVAVAFAYLQFSAQVNTWDVIMALIRQLVERTTRPTVLSLVDAAFKQHEHTDSPPPLSELVKLLRDILQEYKEQFISLDGLDEMLPARRMELLDILLSLEANIIIFSRPLTLLKARMEKQSTFKPGFFDIVANPVDLDLFIAHIIDTTEGFGELLDEHGLRMEIMKKIKDKAGGMFLHAALHIEALRSCTCPQDILEETERFPVEIEDLYAGTVKRIEKEPERRLTLAKRVLVWLLNVRGTFVMDDLRHAVAVSPTTHGFESSRMVSEDLILSICHGLIVVDEQSRQVSLIHYTAHEILPGILSGFCPQPQDMITRTCLARLVDCGCQQCKFETVGERKLAFESNPLLKYSHNSVYDHIQQVIPSSSNIRTVVEQFVRQIDGYPYYNRRGEVEDARLLHKLTPLHVAVLFDMPDLVLGLINEGFDVDTRAGRSLGGGWTSLMLASREGRERVVDVLLDHQEIDMSRADENGWNPLHLAAIYGHTYIAEQLLRAMGALEGSQESRSARVKEVNQVDNNGWTALMKASRHGYHDVVKLLLDVLGTEVNSVINSGWSALMLASRHGFARIVRMLLDVPGVEVNLINTRGWSALMLASRHGFIDVAKSLLDHPRTDPNLANRKGTSALLHAVVYGHTSIVKLLLDTAGTQVNRLNNTGWSPLMAASDYGHTSIVKILLNTPGVQGNLQDHEGWSALMVASYNAHLPVVKLLVGFQGIGVNLVNSNGWSALMIASRHGYDALVKLLLTNPAIDSNLVEAAERRSALMMASHYGHRLVVKHLLEVAGIDVNMVNIWGWSALMLASHKGHDDIVKMLLGTPGIEVNSVDEKGWSALMQASRNGSESVVEMLLEAPDVDVNVVDNAGRSALMLAMTWGQGTVVQRLLKVPGIHFDLVNDGGSIVRREENGINVQVFEEFIS